MLLVGAVLLVALVIFLCFKLGVRRALGIFTVGLGPQRRNRGPEDPGAGSNLAEQARTSAGDAPQEWRITIGLDGAPGADLHRQQRRDLGQELRNGLGEAIVEDGGSPIFVYVNTRETAEAAGQVAREVASQHGLLADVSVECWHPLEELWADAAAKSRHNLAEEARISHDHEQQEDRRRSAETGNAEWQVWVELRTHRDTVALAKQLSADGHAGKSVVRRWKSLVAGANSDDDAHRLAETIQSYTAADANIHVKRAAPTPYVPPASPLP